MNRACLLLLAFVCPALLQPHRRLQEAVQDNAMLVTTFNNNQAESNTMQEELQQSNRVKPTLDRETPFDITYVRIKYKSPQSESFKFLKNIHEDGELNYWQYYSSSNTV